MNRRELFSGAVVAATAAASPIEPLKRKNYELPKPLEHSLSDKIYFDKPIVVQNGQMITVTCNVTMSRA